MNEPTAYERSIQKCLLPMLNNIDYHANGLLFSCVYRARDGFKREDWQVVETALNRIEDIFYRHYHHLQPSARRKTAHGMRKHVFDFFVLRDFDRSERGEMDGVEERTSWQDGYDHYL